jgi:alpha,alpha-trehalase
VRSYEATGKLVEKYDLRSANGGAGGEYATQIGFGWTNGVLRRLMTLNPNVAASDRSAGSRRRFRR